MKIRIENYTFDASSKTIDFDDYGAITLDAILLAVNVTDNIIIYNFADPLKGGTVAGNVLTCTFDTTSMADADDLLIFYDDALISGDTTDLALEAGGNLADVATDTGTIAGDTTSIDGKITACDTSALATSALQLPDGHNVTVDNAAGAAAVNVQDGGNTITVDGTVAIQEPLSVDDNGGSLTVDNADITSIKTAVEKIDNQEDPITYYTVQKTGTDGTIVASPGAGHHLRIHHIYVVNCDTTDTEFYIRNGSAGTPYFPYYLAAYGGAVAQNLKRPWDLSTNTALYYDYISGTTPDCFITVGYEDITE